MNTYILSTWNENVFEPLSRFKCYFIAGNHDLFYKQSSSVTLQSSLQLDKKYGFELINASPKTIILDGRSIDLVPWITTNNQSEITDFIFNSSSPLLIAHLETAGAIISPGTLCQHSQLENNLLTKYHKVISGHFHIRSVVDNIYYIGNPYQIVWSDYGYDKGFVILDTEDLSIEYINNPYNLFEKIDFNKVTKNSDLSIYANKHIKLYIDIKSKKAKVEAFISVLEKLNPLSLIIQEQELDTSETNKLNTEGMQLVDTSHYIELYVEELFKNQSLKLDKDKLLSIINSIYQDALKQEL